MKTGSSLVIVGCPQGLHSVVEAAQALTSPPGDIVMAVPAGWSVAPAARPFVSTGAIQVASGPAATPGALRNTGVRASQGAWVVVLEGDCFPDREYLETIIGLGEGAGARFVTASARPGGVIDLSTAIGASDPVHPWSAFRRDAWESVGGFDEELLEYETYEFWLRLLEHGHKGVTIEPPAPSRPAGAQGPSARRPKAWDARSSFRAVLIKHRASFSEHLANAVCERDRRLEDLRSAGGTLRGLAAAAGHELNTLNQDIATVAGALHEIGRAPLEWGDFNRAAPISSEWGWDRGRCIDRYYIERFLETHAGDVHGRVLEVHDSDYTEKYGGHRVSHCDVIDINASNPRATVITDLRQAGMQSHRYDCLILTQALHLIYDMRSVLGECVRLLKPGGTLLATLPCLSRIAPEQGLEGDFWRFTNAAARAMFEEFFPPEELEVRPHGNVLVDVAYLYGLACHELSEHEFSADDPYFPLVITVRARTREEETAREYPLP